jgi:hypothetical protein
MTYIFKISDFLTATLQKPYQAGLESGLKELDGQTLDSFAKLHEIPEASLQGIPKSLPTADLQPLIKGYTHANATISPVYANVAKAAIKIKNLLSKPT